MHPAAAVWFPYILRLSRVSYFTFSDIFEWHCRSLGKMPTNHSVTDKLAPITAWTLPIHRELIILGVFIPMLFTSLLTMKIVRKIHFTIELNLVLGLPGSVYCLPSGQFLLSTTVSSPLFNRRVDSFSFIASFACNLLPRPFTAQATFPGHSLLCNYLLKYGLQN